SEIATNAPPDAAAIAAVVSVRQLSSSSSMIFCLRGLPGRRLRFGSCNNLQARPGVSWRQVARCGFVRGLLHCSPCLLLERLPVGVADELREPRVDRDHREDREGLAPGAFSQSPTLSWQSPWVQE